MAIFSILLTALIIIVSILLIMVVLVQRPKQEGLGAAFGGGAFDSTLGAHTTDVLQKITTVLGATFFVCAIGLAMVKARQFNTPAASGVLDKLEKSEIAVPPIPSEIQKIIDGAGSESGADAAAESEAAAEASDTAESEGTVENEGTAENEESSKDGE